MLSLGIDLSEEKMDLTLLRDSLRGPRLKAKARFYLPQGETTVAERRQDRAQKLRQFVIENSAQSAEVVVGLPRRHFLMRNVSIPAVRPEDVNRIMRYEADRHIPFDVSQVYFDTVCTENGRSAGAMEILFVAIRKNTMDELLEPVLAAGLKISAVDVASFATAIAYLDRAGKDDTQTAFVEIGEATVILSLLCGGRLRSSRAFPLARILGAAGEGPDAADALASAIVDELDTLAHSAAMEPGEKTFSHLVVTGPGASNPELVSGLERRLELEALLYAPLGQRTELSAEEAADMSRATSLALRGLSASMGGLNFLPEETRTVRKDYGPHLAAGLVALVVLQLGILYGHGLYVRGLRVEALEAQKVQVLPQVDSVTELETELAALQAQVDELKTVDEPVVPRMLLLSELTKHLPQEVYLEYLNLKGEAMRIRVHSEGGLQIGPRLGQSPYVIDPKQTDQRNDTITIDATVGFPTKDAGGVSGIGRRAKLMLERLKSSYLALSPRYRRLVGIALLLAVLLILHRTVVSWVLQYDTGLTDQIEGAESLLQKAHEKIASKPALLAKRQALQARMAEEYDVILPYATSGEAGNFIIACMNNLANTAGISLKTVQTTSVSDLGTHYQKIEVAASTTALTQDWTRFLHEVETLRDAPPSTEKEGECGPLPLTVEELTVRPMTGKNQHGANLMFKIAGIIRKPVVPEPAPSGPAKSTLQQPARNRD